jgi:hypothetical protein
MQEVGNDVGDVSVIYLAVFVLTLITYIGNLLKCFSALFADSTIALILFLVLSVIEVCGFIGLIAVYGISH